MQQGKFNVLLDGFWGSSGKGKMSAFLVDLHKVKNVSSANFPNAGHTAIAYGKKFVAKVLPTAAVLNRPDFPVRCFLSPGSGFYLEQLRKEAEECGHPDIFIHERASIVTSEHAARERGESEQAGTAHIASTMQGSGAAIADKVMRGKNVKLFTGMSEYSVPGPDFRMMTQQAINQTMFHEGSQGYALSIDHGSHYPHCTSRNCTVQAAMDYMAVAPQKLGDVYLNLRTYPIRVGDFEGNSSGGWYTDCEELEWADVAARSGMPAEEAAKLADRERTTVTKRIRRVATFSWLGMKDACEVNGVTKILLNFAQYLDWSDYKRRGETRFELSATTRKFINKIESMVQIPVVAVGTGPDQEDVVITGEP